MTEAYIYDALRTPRGKGRKDGSLHEVTALGVYGQLSRLLALCPTSPLTDEVLFGKLKGGGRVCVDVNDAGEFVFTYPE